MGSLRHHLTYANVLATIAVFVALGGSGYAAVKLNGKNIKNRSIAGKKLKRGTLTGKEVKESRLGKVRVASRADQANEASNAAALGGAPAADYLRSGAIANPPWETLTLQNGWEPSLDGVPAVYQDRLGIVHLKGVVQDGTGVAATLPERYRPATVRIFITFCVGGTGSIDVRPNGDVEIIPTGGANCQTGASLDPVSFRPDG